MRKKPSALAGIMGGLDSRVTDTTRDIFLEAAHFVPATIMGRARNLALHTDASHRFERGVDPELPRIAMERATQLVLSIAGGTPGPITETTIEASLPKRHAVSLRRARLARVLGITVGDAEVERILTALDMNVERTNDGWKATPPTRRFDIEIEEDLIEEVARIHGYDNVPTHAPSGELALHLRPEKEVLDRAAEFAAGLVGLSRSDLLQLRRSRVAGKMVARRRRRRAGESAQRRSRPSCARRCCRGSSKSCK